MKTQKTQTESKGVRRPERARIEFAFANAHNVSIAGSLNNWEPHENPIIALGEGRWATELTLIPGSYEYRLLVDGQWMTDPQAKETVPNPFGSVNAVLRVGAGSSRTGAAGTSEASPERSYLEAAQHEGPGTR